MGLPGSGKTTLARKLNLAMPTSYMLNADDVRAKANDWDFSIEGRIRQAQRMRDLADSSGYKCVIADFVCGIPEQRDIFRPHILVWMNTITAGRYTDTNAAFVNPVVEPAICKIRFDSFEAVNLQKVIDAVKISCQQSLYGRFECYN